MKARRTRWLAVLALVAYVAILIKLVVFKAIPTIRVGHLRLRFAGPHTGPANLVPFKTIAPQIIGRGNHLVNMVNLFGNTLPFMPVGFLARFVFRSFSWQKALILGVGTGLCFELLELIFHVGIFDVDDVIMNAAGVMLGYGVSVMFKPRSTRA